MCDAEIDWIYPAAGRLEYGGTWHGHDGVKSFLDAHDRAEEILEFRVEDLMERGDSVVARGRFRGRAKATGREWETRFVHVITLRDGRWRRLEAFFDTAAAVAAHAPRVE